MAWVKRGGRWWVDLVARRRKIRCWLRSDHTAALAVLVGRLLPLWLGLRRRPRFVSGHYGKAAAIHFNRRFDRRSRAIVCDNGQPAAPLFGRRFSGDNLTDLEIPVYRSPTAQEC